MVEDFGPEAIGWNEKMIVISPQLSDWREASARQTIALTEYLLEAYNIDPEKIYLEGYSGGGETGSLVMGMRPELYTAYLMVSSQWDGDLEVLAQAKTPVYLVTGEQDSYYGSDSMKSAAAELRALYEKHGLPDEEIDRLLVLDVKPQSYFTDRGITDQHGGEMAIAKDHCTKKEKPDILRSQRKYNFNRTYRRVSSWQRSRRQAEIIWASSLPNSRSSTTTFYSVRSGRGRRSSLPGTAA